MNEADFSSMATGVVAGNHSQKNIYQGLWVGGKASQ